MDGVLSITLTGLIVVFAVLGILYIIFSLFGVTLSSKKKEEQNNVAKVIIKEKKTQEQKSEYDESEVVAAISAALHEMLGRSFKIRKISPVSGKKSNWKTRAPQVYWKPRRNKVC